MNKEVKAEAEAKQRKGSSAKRVRNTGTCGNRAPTSESYPSSFLQGLILELGYHFFFNIVFIVSNIEINQPNYKISLLKCVRRQLKKKKKVKRPK